MFKRITLTPAQHGVLMSALDWIDSAGDHCEFFDAQPAGLRRVFDAMKARVERGERYPQPSRRARKRAAERPDR